MADKQLQHALRCLFDQGRDPMFITDEQGRILHANPAFLSLYHYQTDDLAHLENSGVWQNPLHDVDDYQKFLDTVKQQGYWSGELHVTSKDGEIIPVWTQIVWADGHFAVTQVDLRERDKITRKMEQLSRLQSVATLAGGVAHEFNNIMGGLQGHLYLLKRTLEDNPKEQERFVRINKLLERATSLVQNLLAFSRQEHMAAKDMMLQQVLRDVHNMCLRNMDKRIAFNLVMPDEPLVVRADIVAFKQHMFELVSNAQSAVVRKLQHHGEHTDGKIEIHLSSREDHMAEIVILDNGCGMQDAVLKHCLDPFFTTEPVGKGTGLGLPSALAYAEQLQGGLEVESVFGEYTKVRIWLPLHAQTEVVADKGRILLVDDEEDLRDSIEEILAYHGYQVTTASNGVEGLDIWLQQREQIDAIVMDIVMPGMTGIEVAAEVRKQDQDLPVFLTTGYAQQAVPEHLHVNLIRKPLNPDLLLELLDATVYKQHSGSAD